MFCRQNFCLSVIEGIHLFQGVTDSTMGHGEGWNSSRWDALSAFRHGESMNLYHREFWGQAGNPAEGSEYLRDRLLRSCTAFEAYARPTLPT